MVMTQKKATIVVDGASSGNPGPGTISAVMWIHGKGYTDAKRRPDVCECRTHVELPQLKQCTNNEAEGHAILLGLDFVTTHKIDRAYMYSDSRVMVGITTGACEAKSPLTTYMASLLIPKYQLLMGVVELMWVSRYITAQAERYMQEFKNTGG